MSCLVFVFVAYLLQSPSPNFEKGLQSVVLLLQFREVRQSGKCENQQVAELVREQASLIRRQLVQHAKEGNSKAEETGLNEEKVLAAIGGEDLDWLLSIYIQREGWRAILNPYIAHRIGVGDARFKEIASRYERDVAELTRSKVLNDSSSIEESIESSAKISKSALAKLKEFLTEDEKRALFEIRDKVDFVVPRHMKRLATIPMDDQK